MKGGENVCWETKLGGFVVLRKGIGEGKKICCGGFREGQLGGRGFLLEWGVVLGLRIWGVSEDLF